MCYSRHSWRRRTRFPFCSRSSRSCFVSIPSHLRTRTLTNRNFSSYRACRLVTCVSTSPLSSQGRIRSIADRFHSGTTRSGTRCIQFDLRLVAWFPPRTADIRSLRLPRSNVQPDISGTCRLLVNTRPACTFHLLSIRAGQFVAPLPISHNTVLS